MGAIEFSSRPGAVGQRGADIGKKAYELGLWCRNIGDSIVLSPPLTITESEIDDIFSIIQAAAKAAG
jgi:beta-alanine--pyruvate transaminase